MRPHAEIINGQPLKVESLPQLVQSTGQWGMWRPASATDRPARAVAYRELDPDGCPMVRVGKRAAGRLLDGSTHDEYPIKVAAPATRTHPVEETA